MLRSHSRPLDFFLVAGALFLTFHSPLRAQAPESLFAPPPDMAAGEPANFPRFFIKGNASLAQQLNHWLWLQLSQRPANWSRNLARKDVTSLADLWMSGAQDRLQKKPITEVYRALLSDSWPGTDGLIPSTSGNPLEWYELPGGFAGRSAGWYFQNRSGTQGPSPLQEYIGESATRLWTAVNLQSLGILNQSWQLRATGASPSLLSPAGISIQAAWSPVLQVRWARSSASRKQFPPYMEWLRQQDTEFNEERRLYFPTEAETNGAAMQTVRLALYRHPLWNGTIRRIRLSLAPDGGDGKFAIESILFGLENRSPDLNLALVQASWNYFRWTGDLPFLRKQMGVMRQALRSIVSASPESPAFRNPLPGQDGRSSASATPRAEPHGIGSHPHLPLPFGNEDLLTSAQYYNALIALAESEEAFAAHPAWGSSGGDTWNPQELRRIAAAVKAAANQRYWNPVADRFAGCVDADGLIQDFGFVALNAEAVWRGLATEEHSRRIFDWIAGKRIISGDTATGDAIYQFEAAPRFSTRANTSWTILGGHSEDPAAFGKNPWNGGAILGTSFFDLSGRMEVYGADEAWEQLIKLGNWRASVIKAGGYGSYWSSKGVAAKSVLTDDELGESSLVPSFVLYGIMGISPRANSLSIIPRLPRSIDEMGISGILYHGTRLDVRITRSNIAILVHDTPLIPLHLEFNREMTSAQNVRSNEFTLLQSGSYTFDVK